MLAWEKHPSTRIYMGRADFFRPKYPSISKTTGVDTPGPAARIQHAFGEALSVDCEGTGDFQGDPRTSKSAAEVCDFC